MTYVSTGHKADREAQIAKLEAQIAQYDEIMRELATKENRTTEDVETVVILAGYIVKKQNEIESLRQS